MHQKSTLKVCIIGAGLGGVAGAVYLRKAGFEDVTIFEKSAGPGGIWWDNSYPGAECDVPSAFYSYSFAPHRWTRTHAGQREIQAYVADVIQRFGLADRVHYSTAVREARWEEARQEYTVRTDHDEFRFDVVISAVGMLNVPNYPRWPGLEDFRGPKFHTARWEHEHHLADKRVAVVGTGSTAAQVVPALARNVGEVIMFSREPAYVMPKNERDFTAEEIARNAAPLRRKLMRARTFWNVEKNVAWRSPKSRAQKHSRQSCLNYVEDVFADRPDLKAYATPDYPYGCKRPVQSTDLYPSLKQPNVRLVPNAVTAVTADGVIDDAGREHKADVLVMATGFKPWDFLSSVNIVGRGGRSLKGVWGEEPEAYLGIQVTGFPNLFIMYGPNTNFFCVTFMLEQQASYIVRALKRLVRKKGSAIEVRRSVMDFYNRRLDRSLSGKVLEAECHNYYHTATGRNVVTFPWRGTFFWLLTRFPGFATSVRKKTEGRSHLDSTRAAAKPEASGPRFEGLAA